VARGTHFDVQRLAHRRTGFEAVAAGAGHCDDFVAGVNAFFHAGFFLKRSKAGSLVRIIEPRVG
jgi:hypothetical protein